jgi:putative transposase
MGSVWAGAGGAVHARSGESPVHRRRSEHLWVANFTYVAMSVGTVSVAFAIDAFSDKIMGWQASTPKKTDLILDVIEAGLRRRNYQWRAGQEEPIHHSVELRQYTSLWFTQPLIDSDIDTSIGTVVIRRTTRWRSPLSVCTKHN